MRRTALRTSIFDVRPVPFSVLAAAVAAISLIATGAAKSEARTGPNVLFVIVDDLRPELNCYGESQIRSPNIDRLAGRGMIFRRAYCQQAVCGPSRTSVLTGMRPDSTGIHVNNRHFRENVPDCVTLPQHFKNHGYHSQGMGKVFHGAYADLNVDLRDPPSWSVPFWQPGPQAYYSPHGIAIARETYKKMYDKENPGPDDWKKAWVTGPATEAPRVHDSVPYDGQVADKAVEALRQVGREKRPFFLAVGFRRPHLPFVAPKKYWEMYDPAEIKLADNPFAPKGAPRLAMTDWFELRMYHDIPEEGPLADEKARQLIHGYYACVSYADAQVGRVLDELDRLGLRDDTIIVLWGDHGWHLGDHGLWSKCTNFETATRSTLIFSIPQMKTAGGHADALVELLDIYPTLVDLAGLPLPEHLEGTSLAPLLANPDRPLKSAAFSQYPRGKNVMGYSIRAERYRYTEWLDRNDGKVVARELYDHQVDPQENENLAGRPCNAALVGELSTKLRAAKPAER